MHKYNRKIEDCLHNLEDLNLSELSELANNLEIYFEELSDTQLSKIKILLKSVVSYGEWDDTFNKSNIEIRFINGEPNFINDAKQRCFLYNDELLVTPKLDRISGEEALEIGRVNHKRYVESESWKFNIKKLDNLNEYTSYKTADESIVIVEDDILRFISESTSSKLTMMLLLEAAQSNGVSKAESYQKEFSTYIKSGFIPVSICKWSKKNVTDDWLLANGLTLDDDIENIPNDDLVAKREATIFYVHVNDFDMKDFTNIKLKEWFKSIGGYSESREDAEAKRDLAYSKFMGGK